MRRPERLEPGPGEESVWDYPVHARIESTVSTIEVLCASTRIAHSTNALRVLEKGHPPTIYVPPEDVLTDVLRPSARRPTICQNKGLIVHFNVIVGDCFEVDAAWTFSRPRNGFEELADKIAFSPHHMDACFVDGERVRGHGTSATSGWITSHILGPFKGPGGTYFW